MFGDMAAAADSGMAMPFYPLQDQEGELTTDPHHHMLCFMGSSNSHPVPHPNPALMPRPPPPPPAPASTSNATLLPPPVPNPSSSLPSPPKYKFVTGSPADWCADEIATLNQGLIRYAHEPSIMKYVKIAAMLPTKTIRDVALRCVWTPGKESSRRKPDGYHAGTNMTYSKNKMAASTSVTNIPMPLPNNVFPFSISLHHPSQNNLVSVEVPILDSATQLLEENNQLLSQIAANIRTLKTEENGDLFLHANNNIRAISERMRETLGIMDHMPSLPVHVNEEHLSSLVHLHRGARLT
ncbi:hypothetical protein BDA96_07G000200 [Sorghum bicolor]|uniref:Uncharacterized protein n=2 Tax=Sorghum bicolor TaxID=4558 RepID=A0A921U8Y3_SORBI|nr:uncharacterized protein LOC8064311 isoform X3 [Sorghum bicolor]EES13175.2 hypothetical protein SORBI_3007G000300 [Sorghum bicolor]KAG0522010.1 hypothetical protein BDA96_07G000200 [Sorghum bicolor]|eukprot:XP_002443680.2 uncharacterized protein LOC8064311 isoform X3 [Sorghum bicolor]